MGDQEFSLSTGVTNILITMLVCATVVGFAKTVKSCEVGKDVGRARCISSGGDPYQCCVAFESRNPCKHLKP